jgi:hypothetical protein
MSSRAGPPGRAAQVGQRRHSGLAGAGWSAEAARSTTMLSRAEATAPSTTALDKMPGWSTSGWLALACAEKTTALIRRGGQRRRLFTRPPARPSQDREHRSLSGRRCRRRALSPSAPSRYQQVGGALAETIIARRRISASPASSTATHASDGSNQRASRSCFSGQSLNWRSTRNR